MATLVHLDKGIVPLYGFQLGGQIARRPTAHIPVVEVVGRADKDRGILFGCVFRAVDVRRHSLAVAHGHHQLALDDGYRLEFRFERASLCDIQWFSLLGRSAGNDGEDDSSG